MSRFEVVRATEEHARAMAPHMNSADAEEVWAADYSTPLGALLASVRGTDHPVAWLRGDEVLCLFGVHAPILLGDWAVFWMLASARLGDHPTRFLRGSRGVIEAARGEYKLLLNYVDARHIVSLRWLKWLGFEVLPAEPYGVEGLPFHLVKLEDR